MTLDIAFWQPGRHVQVACSDQKIKFGHADDVLCILPASDDDEKQGSRQNLSFTVSVTEDGQRARLNNEGADNVIDIWGSETIAAGTTTRITLPCLLKVATHYIELRPRLEPIQSADSYTILYERDQNAAAIPRGLLGKAPSSDTLASWFNALADLQRAAATSPEFYDLAASAIDYPGGLDRGLVLLRRDESIEIAASAQSDPRLGLTYRHDLVNEAIAHGRTLVSGSGDSTRAADDAVVVVPIFGPNGLAIGAIYGVRSLHPSNQRSAIRPLEALWVQLVAEAVGAGIQRVTAETTAARTRLMFEQVFTPTLIDELLRNPDVLRPQKREITVLFCDLRDSTVLGQRLDPEPMYQLLSEVLERLTAKVTEAGGVIIDYYGDGLAAMWNAPHDQPDHAMLACRAAVAMVGQINAVNMSYQKLLGQPLRLGIGIHTDAAYVGNAGSSQRLKYGPRGHMVSLASRLENATKRIKTPILLSRNTRDQIKNLADVRQLCHAKLRGISAPVELFELRGLKADRQRQKLFHELESMETVLECLSGDALPDADFTLQQVALLDEFQPDHEEIVVNQVGSTRIVDLTRI